MKPPLQATYCGSMRPLLLLCTLFVICVIVINVWALKTSTQSAAARAALRQLQTVAATARAIDSASIGTLSVSPIRAINKGLPELALWLGGSGAPVPDCPADCHPQVHCDMLGEAVAAGGQRNLQANAGECCAACRAHAVRPGQRPCNVWVYCGDRAACGQNYQHCWLKHQPNPMAEPMVGGLGVSWGKLVPWTSGVLDQQHLSRGVGAVSNVGLALITEKGGIRLRLNLAASPNASRWLAEIVMPATQSRTDRARAFLESTPSPLRCRRTPLHDATAAASTEQSLCRLGGGATGSSDRPTRCYKARSGHPTRPVPQPLRT